MYRCLAILSIGLVIFGLTGCTQQGQTASPDPFNRFAFPPPKTGEARMDPYYSPPQNTATSAPGLGMPSTFANPASGATGGTANNAIPANGRVSGGSSRPTGLWGNTARSSPANSAGVNNAPPSNVWSANNSAAGAVSLPRPVVTEVGASSNQTLPACPGVASPSNSGAIRDISETARVSD
jgi:hypothetical protein